MPPHRPATTGYERLAQADQLSDDSDDEHLAQSSVSLGPASVPRYASIANPRSGLTSPKHLQRPAKFRPRSGSNVGVDIKAINARLERWADEIASRFKRRHSKSNAGDDEPLEIHYSVFQAPDGVRPVTAQSLDASQEGVMTKAEFDAVVDSVRRAIRQEMHPSMISQGSSGSYFARNPDGKIVGVFKPKDEEPYAAGNPKWNKWIHRNLFPCFFGRACLIPNLSYVSEAAAYVLDRQLRTNLVPYTDVVWLSSKSFHYPFWDRRSFRSKKKPLPAKPGSFQVFLKGFKDANVFLREHPWPAQYWSGFRTRDSNAQNKRRRWADNCRPSTAGPPDTADDSGDEEQAREDMPLGPDNFIWTESLKQSLREELEKLVILDYIMRNNDRGLDNWMIKVDWESGEVSLASDPVQFNMSAVGGDEQEEENAPRPVDISQKPTAAARASNPYLSHQPMKASSPRPQGAEPAISIGAIDNSLSWPWKHPDAWRSFPFGWLFLPVDLIGRPFSQKTRDHFLPLLTSTAWWSQTQAALKKIFQMDADFQERMFAKQMAVMKGQAWNVVEALKTADHGPLELTRRTKVCVWDDLTDIPVAVPMRITSSEIVRDPKAPQPIDEADIAASAPSHQGRPIPDLDLLGSTSPPADMPHSGRFELASQTEENAQSPTKSSRRENSTDGAQTGLLRPGIRSQNYRQSYQGPLNTLPNDFHAGRHRHQRRYSSFGGGGGGSIAHHLHGHRGHSIYNDEDDEDEGDLGYATAEGQMSNQRKVIVERLEVVKSKNPVFTWC